jgi:hypothetical protein
VVFVNVTEASPVRAARPGRRSGPLQQELAFYHVTVAHHLSDALDRAYEALADYDCSFDVSAFQLYVHGGDGVAPRCELHAVRRRKRASVRRIAMR